MIYAYAYKREGTYVSGVHAGEAYPAGTLAIYQGRVIITEDQAEAKRWQWPEVDIVILEAIPENAITIAEWTQGPAITRGPA